MNYFVLLLPPTVAFLITTLATPLLLPLIKKLGVISDPSLKNHPAMIHTTPVPRGGSLPFFLGAAIAIILFIPLTPKISAILIASFLALLIGLIDDKLNALSKDVSPYLRFLINILCAVIIVSSGITITYITNPFGGIIHLDVFRLGFFGFSISLSDVLSGMWIIWVMNMLNWSKGVDGQMPGIVAISAIVIGILSLRFGVGNIIPVDATLSFIIAGASLGFLIYNMYPQKIMPGYGATSIYLLLAVVSILSSSKLATAILVMGVPTVDAIFTIGRRILNKKSPFNGDRKHLHHLLLDLGYSKRQVALFYWCISAILGLISLTLESRSKAFALIMVVIITGMVLLFLHYVTNFRNEKETA